MGQGRWNVPLSVPGKQILQLSIVIVKIAAHKGGYYYYNNIIVIIWLIPAQEVGLTSPTSTSS